MQNGFESLISMSLVDQQVRNDVKTNPEKYIKDFSLNHEEAAKLNSMSLESLNGLAKSVEDAMNISVNDLLDGACM